MALTKSEKAAVITQYGDSATDTGKSEVQIALLTEEIKQLTTHLIANKKDNIAKRGLHIKVSRRKQLLSHLKKNDIERYRNIIKLLGLRG